MQKMRWKEREFCLKTLKTFFETNSTTHHMPHR